MYDVPNEIRDYIEAYLKMWEDEESYNAVLINQGKNQKERMELLLQLVVQQLQMLETVGLNNLPEFRK